MNFISSGAFAISGVVVGRPKQRHRRAGTVKQLRFKMFFSFWISIFFYIMNPCSKFWKQTRERVDLSSKFSERKGKKRIKENKVQTVTDFLTLVDPIRFVWSLL